MRRKNNKKGLKYDRMTELAKMTLKSYFYFWEINKSIDVNFYILLLLI